jgi:predicted transposase/invertase (TIGR01784 family)
VAITLRPKWSEVFHAFTQKDIPILLQDLRESKVIQNYIQEGKREGKLEGKRETARRLFGMGLTLEQVKRATELDTDTLRALQAEAGS